MSLRILHAGPGATIQDGGRFFHQRHGVTPAGPMDWVAFRTANLALGNTLDAAALEIAIGGLDLSCEERPQAIAFCGGAFEWRRNGHALPKAACLTLQPGETLTARPGAGAPGSCWGSWTYLAVAGGFATPPVMGSRATHTRSGLGGLEGRMMRKGDLLPTEAKVLAVPDQSLEAPWLAPRPALLRVVPGPQEDYFTPEAIECFYSGVFTLSPVMDRMAYRLEGPRIAHARGFNIISDGIAEGAIQIAGDQHPLILMADHQPTGGYPKIGHVIRADFGTLAQLRPGASLRFTPVSPAAAREALFALEAMVATTQDYLQPLFRPPTTESLLAANLIGGMVDALTAGVQP
ncbi:biotin-dependent carboxyltransferase family protein [Beijerinckia indica]|uniref:Urea amidolyase related protein n=1 Tax=Beijerinckia indica subsp. indica (strain ATCC 9039 / DSM 1715 / NCIMB 8712) TaxID=395963 RepID=B2ICA6_BEII9|nr:biotin-dependent carboxyltransferase family protein [Beijerinckia indica]ACB96703.1 urea amidolyase related protein [Beijerinckia indica subsp. indica ATCC 9039]